MDVCTVFARGRQVMAVGGRDCSVQRRHQKIIEEGPVAAMAPERWRQMEVAAIRLAKAVCVCCLGLVRRGWNFFMFCFVLNEPPFFCLCLFRLSFFVRVHLVFLFALLLFCLVQTFCFEVCFCFCFCRSIFIF